MKPGARWALACALAVVDRIERDDTGGDRVVLEWCDRTTSDLPIALFPSDIAEGAEVDLAFVAANPLPGPSRPVADPHSAGRDGAAASDQRGARRTESP